MYELEEKATQERDGDRERVFIHAYVHLHKCIQSVHACREESKTKRQKENEKERATERERGRKEEDRDVERAEARERDR